jgi:hypothetical protein
LYIRCGCMTEYYGISLYLSVLNGIQLLLSLNDIPSVQSEKCPRLKILDFEPSLEGTFP